MPIVVNEVSVDVGARRPRPPRPPPRRRPQPPSDAAIADAAERHWKRVADLQERVRAD